MTSSEKLDLASERWQSIGNMSNKRCGFNPVGYLRDIWLIGGQGNDRNEREIEKYNIDTGVFSSTAWLLADYFTVSYEINSSIIILNGDKRYKVENGNKLTEVSKGNSAIHQWASLAVEWNGSIYYLRNQGSGPFELHRITVNSLEVTKILEVVY